MIVKYQLKIVRSIIVIQNFKEKKDEKTDYIISH